MERPATLMVVGFVLLLIGAGLPFLMVIRVVEPSLLLSFLAHSCSTAGFITGLIGIAWYARHGK